MWVAEGSTNTYHKKKFCNLYRSSGCDEIVKYVRETWHSHREIRNITEIFYKYSTFQLTRKCRIILQ